MNREVFNDATGCIKEVHGYGIDLIEKNLGEVNG